MNTRYTKFTVYLFYVEREVMKIEKGNIYYADLNPGIGCEQVGKRPVVIVQNNKGNNYSPTTIVAPLTNYRNYKKRLPTHALIKKGDGIKVDSIALLEQIRVIDKNRLGNYITKVNEDNLKEINNSMMISLDINGGKE